MAHGNIAPPLVVGQALAYAVTGRFSWQMALAVHVFGVIDHLFIVFANDYADRGPDAAVDTKTPFSGGSRVLPEGKLRPVDLRRAATWMAFLLVALSMWLAVRHDIPSMVLWALAALSLLLAYSFPPLSLSYRGGGEVLQGIGVGLVLPAVGFAVQAGGVSELPWAALLPTVLLGTFGNVLTALPDYAADRTGGKRTWPVRWGEASARRAITLGSAAALAAFVVLTPPLPLGARIAVLALPVSLLVAAGVVSKGASHRNRSRCLAFVVLVGGAMATFQLGWALALWAAR